MRIWPRDVFGRLVLGLVSVSLVAVAVGAFYLYTRFHNTHSLFFEGTLQAFIGDIADDIHLVDGKLTADVDATTRQRIADESGRYVVLDDKGRIVAASPGVTERFTSFRTDRPLYFWIPRQAEEGEYYGLSWRVPHMPVPVYVQLMFPKGHIIFESVLHEFMKDIAWIWLPFLLAILAVNVIVVRIALAPLSQTVEEARAIQPGGAASLTEKGLPDDLLALVRTVNAAFDRLREAHRLQEEFVADMAHELRTPLAVMKAELATMKDPHARILEHDLGVMARLVEQLLDRARVGRFNLEAGKIVDLREVAREASAFLAPRIVGRGRMIEVIAPDIPVLVAGGRDDVFRAVRNLVENALEHTPDRGLISVEITAAPSIVVRDQGPGFPEQVLDREARRSGRVRSERREGVGLGLSIVERTMMAHGGDLTLSNDPGAGGSATMRFPDAGWLPAA